MRMISELCFGRKKEALIRCQKVLFTHSLNMNLGE